MAVLALVVLVGYYFLRSRSGAPATGGIPPTGGLPIPTQSGSQPQQGQVPQGQPVQPPLSYTGNRFGIVAQNPVLDFFVDKQNNVLLVQPDGRIIKLANGQQSILNSSTITDLVQAIFSYDGAKILAVFGNQTNSQASVFDVATKAWQPLAGIIKSAAWSPNNYQIAYFSEKNGANTLATLDASKTKNRPVELLKIRAQDLTLVWLNPSKILMSDKGSALYAGSVWSFDAKNKTIASIVEDKVGLESLWSGPADLGLIFGINLGGRGGRLSLIDTKGAPLNDLNFLTLPSKCAFDLQIQNQTSTPPSAPTSTKKTSSAPRSSTTTVIKTTVSKLLYCAIPRDSRKMAVNQLPDAYGNKSLFTADDFYQVNLGDGGVAPLFTDQNTTLDAANLKIFNQTVFFLNRLDQKLYAISLK